MSGYVLFPVVHNFLLCILWESNIVVFSTFFLSSVCGLYIGWVCFAEKTHPEVLPFISSIKSAQAIMGVIVKNNVFRSLLLGGDTAAAVHSSATKKVFHVSIQPCFDKKLEASRLVGIQHRHCALM